MIEIKDKDCMTKILILDDDVFRHERFRTILVGHDLTHVWTYTQALIAFRKEKFDMACLDHDLGDQKTKKGKVIVKSPNFNLSFKPDCYEDGMFGVPDYYDGRDVCVWLRDNPQYCPRKVFIHSWNYPGAEQMVDILRNVPNIQIKQMPFSDGC